MSSAFVCVWLIAGVFVALSNFCCLLFHFPESQCSAKMCLFFSLSLSNKKGRNHTRQELISQAANSRSRWSIFFFSFQNERTKWKLWPYMWSSAEQSSWDCFQLRAFHFVSVFLSFYFTLFTPLLISTHLPLWVCTGRRCTAAPPGQQPASGFIQFCIAVLFLGARFTRLIFIAFFFFGMRDIFRKRQVFLLSR